MTQQEADKFMKNVDTTAHFWQEIHNPDTKTININGTDYALILWNLAVTRRDTGMYAKYDMKPNRFWKITDVKKYFGLKGNKHKIDEQINTLCDEFLPKKD